MTNYDDNENRASGFQKDNPYYIGNLRNAARKRKAAGEESPPIRRDVRSLERKHQILFLVIFLVLLSLLLLLLETFTSVHDGLMFETETNPIRIFIKDIRAHPIGLIVVILLSYFLTGIIVGLILGRRKREYDPLRGYEIVTESAEGTSRLMPMETKRKFYTYVNYQRPSGIPLAKDRDTGELITLPWDDERYPLPNRNLLMFGPPGSRKSSGVLIPALYDIVMMGFPFVATDPKGELYKIMYSVLKYFGYTIFVLNTKGNEFINSDCWDCLKIIRESESITQAKTIAMDFAKVLLDNTVDPTTKTTFWDEGNFNCLYLAILYVAKAKAFRPASVQGNTNINAYTGDYNSQRTIREVYSLLASKGDTMEVMIASAISNDPTGDGALLSEIYNNWARNKEKTQIQSGLSMRLWMFGNEELARVLSVDQINFDDLAKPKTAIFVVTSDKNENYKSILKLFVAMMFQRITDIADVSPGQRLAQPLWIILEECGSIGAIPNMQKYISTNRSRNIATMFAFQSLEQLKRLYPNEWETILAGCSMQLCLGANDLTTAKYFSDRSGTQAVVTEMYSEDRNKLFSDTVQNYTVLQQQKRSSEKGVPTLRTDEVMRTKLDQIILSPSTENVTLENKYYYKHHPFYNIKLIDRTTRAEVEHLPGHHIPVWRDKDAEELMYDVVWDDRNLTRKVSVEKKATKNSFADFENRNNPS